MVANIFKAGMQIQVVNASMENMESYLSESDEKNAIERVRLNKNECEEMI